MDNLIAVLSLITCLLCVNSDGWGLDNGLALTPQMGWNSWNEYACHVNERIVQQTMDAFISSGLLKLGYKYVNIDDCWLCSRADDGTPIPCSSTFPNGMKSLADYAHSLNLLFGIYSDAGNDTCAGRSGSLGYETIDANTYASWGVDYLKYDNCYNDGISPEERYTTMRDALNQTGRSIFYSMCEWGVDDPWNWAQPIANSWRTTGDIKDNWESMISNWDKNGPANASSPGGWNDPDMLEVGNGGMSTIEYITHFSLWCIGKAPLLVGCNIMTMSNATRMILMNEDAIAVNQDLMGKQATLKYSNVSGDWNVYSSALVDECLAVVVLNRNEYNISVEVTWNMLGLNVDAVYTARDLWTHDDVDVVNGSYKVEIYGHGVSFVKLIPKS